MNKKYQIFISSTYKDLIKERQAAVEAILQAGHIPAGMELFAASDESQLKVIKRWIDESDIYILILGSRYGSIEPISKKSYIHLEFEYALSKSIPMFSIVLDESKVNYTELNKDSSNFQYKEFRRIVEENICRYFKDKKDIKISILESLMNIINTKNLVGWVSGRDVEDYQNIEIKNQITNELVNSLKIESDNTFNGIPFDELKQILNKETIEIPTGVNIDGEKNKVSLLNAMIKLEAELQLGIDKETSQSNWEWFQRQVGLKLKTYKLTDIGIKSIKFNKNGERFLLQIKRASE